MTKLVKISLATAVAVASMNSVASAKPLEEAIKGVDATGFVTYQYNDGSKTTYNAGGVGTDKTTTTNIYKTGITLTAPATDNVAVKVTGVARGSTSSADVNVATEIAHANFVYTGIQNMTITAGKQALNTPWTQGSSNIDNTQQGTGILAMYNAGFATIAAGHFTNNNIIKSTAVPTGATHSDASVTISDNDLTVAAIIAPIAEIANAQLWYAKISKTAQAQSDVNEGANALNMSFDTKIMDIAKLAVTHSTLKGKAADTLDKKQKLTKAILSGKAGPVGLSAGYAKTGKDGGLVAFDADSSAGFKGYKADLLNKTNANACLVSANMDLMQDLNFSVTNISGKIKGSAATTDDLKFNETYGQLTYKFAKNLSAYVRYGTYDVKLSASNTDQTKKSKEENGRLQISYNF